MKLQMIWNHNNLDYIFQTIDIAGDNNDEEDDNNDGNDSNDFNNVIRCQW